MADCRDYREILLGESLESTDSSSDWEPSGETLGSQDTESTDDSSQSSNSFLVSSQNNQNDGV